MRSQVESELVLAGAITAGRELGSSAAIRPMAVQVCPGFQDAAFATPFSPRRARGFGIF